MIFVQDRFGKDASFRQYSLAIQIIPGFGTSLKSEPETTRNRHDSARALRCSVVSQSVHAEDGLTAPDVCTFLVVPSACDSGDDQAFPLRSAPSAAGLDAVPQEGFCDGESGYGGTRIGEILAPPSLCARCAGTKLLSEEVLDFSLVAWQLSHLMISVSCPV